MKNKNKNGLVAVIVLLAVLVIVLMGYIGYDKVLNKDTNNNIIKENVIEKDNKVDSEESNEYKSFSISDLKCLTDCNNIKYNIGASVAGDGIEVWIANSESTKINVNVDKRLLKYIYVYEFNSNEDVYTFEFNKKIQDMFVGHIGQDTSMPMLFVLLEDGSVQYIDLYTKITTGNSDFIELSNVKNIIKFYSASAYPKDSKYGSIVTVLAQTNDGSFYDLKQIIFNKGE